MYNVSVAIIVVAAFVTILCSVFAIRDVERFSCDSREKLMRLIATQV